ncbi:MAG: hypothetical protein IJH07_04860 [Ruminococcus sp.]|nr:hypothetical protein [Ruminococcus sp.]
MTVYKNSDTVQEKNHYTADELMRLRRERIRDRRRRKGSLIIARILKEVSSEDVSDPELYRLDPAI